MKRIVLTALIALGMLVLPQFAHAFCTQTVITSGVSTKILAQSTSSSAPPRMLYITVGGACGVWCSVGDTAAEGLGLYFGPGGTNPESFFPPQQYPPNTFPQTLSGQVNCFLPTNQTCASSTVNACRQ